MYNAKMVMDYLREKGVRYTVHKHAETATAQETAAAEHVSGKGFAKTVVVRSGDEMLLAVVPAHLQVDLSKLARLSGGGVLELAEEEQFRSLFPDCEVGAMTPFGKVYSLDVFIDDDIAVAPDVTFNACSHEHTITVSGKDFLKTAEGVVGDISED